MPRERLPLPLAAELRPAVPSLLWLLVGDLAREVSKPDRGQLAVRGAPPTEHHILTSMEPEVLLPRLDGFSSRALPAGELLEVEVLMHYMELAVSELLPSMELEATELLPSRELVASRALATREPGDGELLATREPVDGERLAARELVDLGLLATSSEVLPGVWEPTTRESPDLLVAMLAGEPPQLAGLALRPAAGLAAMLVAALALGLAPGAQPTGTTPSTPHPAPRPAEFNWIVIHAMSS